MTGDELSLVAQIDLCKQIRYFESNVQLVKYLNKDKFKSQILQLYIRFKLGKIYNKVMLAKETGKGTI